MLVGRSGEQRRIEALLGGARQGRSGALLLRGEAGIGKTALVEHAVSRAEGMHVSRARGVESEARIAFAAAADLARPFLDKIEQVPEPQRAALLGALALGEPVLGDPFAISLGLLSLLAAAAEDHPILVFVDDAQWLDDASLDAILFVARRLEAEGIALLLASRDGETGSLDDVGIDELPLSGLDIRDAGELLAGVVGKRVPDQIVERVTAAAGGNPLALIELPAVVGAEELARGDALPEDPLPIGKGIERAFRRRLDELPEETQRALLVAAASESGRIDVISSGLAALGLSAKALEPAERAGLVTFQETLLEFRHPLVRSTAYHSSPDPDRRAAHSALAQALGPDEPSARAWHLAAAAIVPDETVAAELEGAGHEARMRGGIAGSAGAFEVAARLTPDREERARRLMEAARSLNLSGRHDAALALLDEALPLVSQPVLRAAVQQQRGWAFIVGGLGGDIFAAHELLTTEAEQVAVHDPKLAAEMLFDAAFPCAMSGRVEAGLTTARRASELAGGLDAAHRVVAQVLLAQANLLAGHAEESLPPTSDELTAAVGQPFGASALVVPLQGQVLGWLERFDAARQLVASAVAAGRASNALSILPYGLAVMAELDYRAGSWDEGYVYAAEAVRLGQDTGQRGVLAFPYVTLARYEAARGQTEECRQHVSRAREIAWAVGARSIDTYSGSVLGLLELGLANWSAAIGALESVAAIVESHGTLDPSAVPWEADLVEAYARGGRKADARARLERLEASAARTERPWPRAAAARCRGLLSEDAADETFSEALEWHARGHDPFERARTQLVYGECLRRVRRRGDAREPLHAALATFEALGAEPWSERARAELRAAGETVKAGPGDPTQRLTAQELQVALAVAAGASNREAAASLFLSPKTIEYHLTNVYAKLGIRSRAQLARLFASRAERRSPGS